MRGRVPAKDTGPAQLAAISRLFSSSLIRELASKGKSSQFARVARMTRLIDQCSPTQTIATLFDRGFKVLERSGCRDEYVYKAALMRKILLGRHSLHTASMMSEFRVGQCKADFVILNGTSTVYEIKSERDSLGRLERQLDAYSRVFARIYVMAAEKHLADLRRSAPPYVGLLRLGSRFHISTVRDARNRADDTSAADIFDAIRTDEARKVLNIFSIEIPDVPNTKLHPVLRERFLGLSARQAHDGMVRVLRITRSQLPLSDLITQLPLSLQTAAMCTSLRKLDHKRLMSAIDTRIEDALAWG